MAENFDPCECVFSHEGAMQRLLALLRNSQSQCTDEECFPDLSGPLASPGNNTDGTVMMFTMGWILLALVLFFLRPSSLSLGGDKKPSNGSGPRQPPPDNSVQ